MRISDILPSQHIACKASASSKKRALELLSQLLAEGQSIPPQDIFENLVSREKLGSTALGHGVALPHGRIKNLAQATGALVVLTRGIDFDAPDHAPVDLLFALLVPEHCTDEHLQLLAQLAELFNQETMRTQLRQAQTSDELVQLIAIG